MPPQERLAMEVRAREHALTFDRVRVFDSLLPGRPAMTVVPQQVDAVTS